MLRQRLPKVGAATAMFIGLALVVIAVQNPICAGFGGSCAPDIAYLAPGLTILLVSIAALVYLHEDVAMLKSD